MIGQLHLVHSIYSAQVCYLKDSSNHCISYTYFKRLLRIDHPTMQMIAFAMETACTYEGRDVETGREREGERENTSFDE
jgi:hypothetical protein